RDPDQSNRQLDGHGGEHVRVRPAGELMSDPSASEERPKPLVSIGLAVYNGARNVERALDTLLAQEFTDFELIVSDDASTDATPSICQRYAARDPRIRFVRAEQNRGAAWNFNRLVELARG